MEKTLKNKYSEEGVLNDFKKKHDLRVYGKQIHQLTDGKGDVGIRTKGKIDFLVKYHGYAHFFVEEFKDRKGA